MTLAARLKRIESEQKAQKGYFAPSLGELKFPENAPTASYSGGLDTTGQDLVVASFVATFTRSDSDTTPPLVDFAYEAHTTPTAVEQWAALGFTLTGNDTSANEDFYINGYITGTSDKTVTFQIDVKNAITMQTTSTGTISLQVAAYSMVEGTLTLTRTK